MDNNSDNKNLEPQIADAGIKTETKQSPVSPAASRSSAAVDEQPRAAHSTTSSPTTSAAVDSIKSQPRPVLTTGTSTTDALRLPLLAVRPPSVAAASGLQTATLDQEPQQSQTRFFACHVCGKCFISLKYLDMHSAIHTQQQQQQLGFVVSSSPHQVSPRAVGVPINFSSPGVLPVAVIGHNRVLAVGAETERFVLPPKPSLLVNSGGGRASETAGDAGVLRLTSPLRSLKASPTSPPAAVRNFARPPLHHSPLAVLPLSPPDAAPVIASAVTPSQPHHSTPAGGGREWTCEICHKTFSQNSSYKNHQRTHSDERPFVCTVCSIGFKERYHLKKHVLFKHSDEAREQCRVCGKRFKDSTAVRAHERIHSDSRPYSCARCSKAFKTSECLWHHENRSKSCGAGLSARRDVRAVVDPTSSASAAGFVVAAGNAHHQRYRRGGGGGRRRGGVLMTSAGKQSSMPSSASESWSAAGAFHARELQDVRTSHASFSTAVTPAAVASSSAIFPCPVSAAAAVINAINSLGYSVTGSPMFSGQLLPSQTSSSNPSTAKAATIRVDGTNYLLAAEQSTTSVAASSPLALSQHLGNVYIPSSQIDAASAQQQATAGVADQAVAASSAHRAGLVLLANCAVRGPEESRAAAAESTTTTTQVKVEPETFLSDYELTSMRSLEASFYERIRMAAGEAARASAALSTCAGGATAGATAADEASKASSDRSASTSTETTLTDTEVTEGEGSGMVVEHGWIPGGDGGAGDPRRLDCTRCGKFFSSVSAFDKHSLVHSEQRPYRCVECDIGFKLKVHLKKHQLYRHSDDYRCECSHCGKRFKDSSAVRLHERIHSTARPFPCFSCGKSFKTRENLWGHTHRGPCGPQLQQIQQPAMQEILTGTSSPPASYALQHQMPGAADASPPTSTSAAVAADEENVVLDDMMVAGHEVVAMSGDSVSDFDDVKPPMTFDRVLDLNNSSSSSSSGSSAGHLSGHVALIGSDPMVAFFNPFPSVFLNGCPGSSSSESGQVTTLVDPDAYDAEERSRMAAISLQQARALLLQSCRILQDGRAILFPSTTGPGSGAAIIQTVPTAVVAPIKREMPDLIPIPIGHHLASPDQQQQQQPLPPASAASPLVSTSKGYLPPFETFRAHTVTAGAGLSSGGDAAADDANAVESAALASATAAETNNNSMVVNLSTHHHYDHDHPDVSDAVIPASASWSNDAQNFAGKTVAPVYLVSSQQQQQQQDRVVVWCDAEVSSVPLPGHGVLG